MRVRIKFTKTGCLKFIGHLDVMRYFQKALRRADIPVALSTGFSPHMIMSFAQPLGVGKTSSGEYFDVDLKEPVKTTEIVEKLNAQMAEGITVLSAVEIEESKKSKGMSMVFAADYLVSLRQGKIQLPSDVEEKLAAFMAQPSILVNKKTKRSEAEIDILPLIFAFDVQQLTKEQMEEGPSGSPADATAFHMCVSAKSGTNLKPELIMQAFGDFAGFTFDPVDLLIHRNETYANFGTDEKPVLKPLDAMALTK